MLTLIVPGLQLPRQALADLTHDLPLPAFARLLGYGRRRTHPSATATSTDTLLAALAGFSAGSGALPAAALRAAPLGGEAGEAQWLCLDPIHLRFEERTLIVDDPRTLALTADEAAQLAVALAPTFAALGELVVLGPAQWNLRLAAPAPAFPTLPEQCLRRAEPLAPTPATAPWRRALNEAQMLLHAHPVNQARAAAGRPVANSLWPWGGGALPPRAAHGHFPARLWADDPVAQGLARHLGGQAAALPPAWPGAEGLAGEARSALAVLDALDLPARVGNGIGWRTAIAQIDRDWLAPALAAVADGRLGTLRLLTPGDAGTVELRYSRADRWKFWRRPAPLTQLAGQLAIETTAAADAHRAAASSVRPHQP